MYEPIRFQQLGIKGQLKRVKVKCINFLLKLGMCILIFYANVNTLMLFDAHIMNINTRSFNCTKI